METEKIVTELYSLRAGLSLIAKEMDKINNEQIAAEMRKTAEINQAHATKVRVTAEDMESILAYRKAEQSAEKARKLYIDSCEKLSKATVCAEKQESWIKECIPIRKRRLAFGILFVLLHLVLAGLSFFNFYLLNFNSYVFIPIFAISLAIGITEIKWAFECYYYLGDKWKYSTVKFIRFIFVIAYVFNVVSYLSVLIIGFIDGSVNTVIVVVIAISTALCTITSTVLIFENYKKYSLKPISTQNERAEKEKYDSMYSRLKSVFEQQKKEYETAMCIAEQKYETECKKIDEQYKRTCATSTQIHTKASKEIWNTLVKKYGSLLDVRDWKILDLVIWQLETHRAETLREALQLSDRETQTNRIVGALRSASEAVQYQIKNGLDRLQIQLNDNFHALANEFALSSRNISNTFNAGMQELQESHANNMLAINKGFEQIVSQSSLQTALLEKADTSSDKLIEAVNKIREA